ncbi:MAG: LemA family protein [Ruminococcus sp.]|nr:LemA family protein [Ruminococcus sp.]
MSKLKLVLIVIVIIVCVCVAGMFLVHSSENAAVGMEEQINSAKSEINVQEKRRADLIPNLVECVKAYDQHEYETLMAIVKERGTDDDTATSVQLAVNAVAEAYPELKSSEQYKQLMTELAVTENLIANYRNAYNERVKEYTTYVRRFPHGFFFGLTGYQVKEYEYLHYEASDTAPAVNFD